MGPSSLIRSRSSKGPRITGEMLWSPADVLLCHGGNNFVKGRVVFTLHHTELESDRRENKGARSFLIGPFLFNGPFQVMDNNP